MEKLTVHFHILSLNCLTRDNQIPNTYNNECKISKSLVWRQNIKYLKE